MTDLRPLSGVLVADLSTGIPGAYCGRLLADGGATVVKLEPVGGDPLRRRRIGRDLAPGEDGALFQFLASGTQSVVIDDANGPTATSLLRQADAVIWSPGTPLTDREELRVETIRQVAPQAPVVAISPFGLEGPWAGRPWSELTLQAWAGSIWWRGSPDRPPVQVGGEIGLWSSGAVAAAALLLARETALRTGVGQLVDVSMLESIVLTHAGMYPLTYRCITKEPFMPRRRLNLPEIEPTKDGWIGFMTVTNQQWNDFSLLVGHPEWADEPELARAAGRAKHEPRIRAAIREYTSGRTTAEVLEQAALLRVPAAPVSDGRTVSEFEHFKERRAFVRSARGGFRQPAPVARFGKDIDSLASAPPAPSLGEHDAQIGKSPASPQASRPAETGGETLPLAGLRIADFTMFWAGPLVGNIFAAMGAEVIHVESTARPDGIRFVTPKQPSDEQWWEWGPMFIAANTNKLGLTLDLSKPEGRDLALRLVAECDVVIENFSPRVMDGLGLGWDVLRSVRPDLIMVRMSAFGLTGPWRDRTGYAQTQEQVSGMASVTGWPDREPIVPNGPCDPIAGIHAAVATLMALEHRRQSGEGMLLDVPMVAAALNVTAELSLEWSAYQHLLTRMGNHSPTAVPHNLYRSADQDSAGRTDCWVALSVVDDQQWVALCYAIGADDWAGDPSLRTVRGRRDLEADIDDRISRWCATRGSDEIVKILWAAGVPTAKVVPPHEIDSVEQLRARRYVEELDHPVVGKALYQGFPARLSAGPQRINRTPSPTLGQHNNRILEGLLGLSESEVQQLRDAGVIGESLGRA